MTNSIEEKRQKLTSFTSKDEAEAYLMELPGDERRKVVLSTNPEHLKFLPFGTSESISPSFYDKSAKETTQEDINQLYTSMFELIRAAQAKAGNQPLHIITGEVHNNKDSFLLNVIIADIAKRLGIENWGLEIPMEDVHYEKGETTWGFANLKKAIESGEYPLNGDDTSYYLLPDATPVNRGAYMSFSKNSGMSAFSIDPKGGFVDWTRQDLTKKEVFYERQDAIADALAKRADESYVCALGVNHLGRLSDLLRPQGHTLIIDAAPTFFMANNTLSNPPENSKRADAVALPSDPLEAAELGKSGTDKIIYAQIPGKGIHYSQKPELENHRFETALAMAKEADKAVGTKLVAEREKQKWVERTGQAREARTSHPLL